MPHSVTQRVSTGNENVATDEKFVRYLYQLEDPSVPGVARYIGQSSSPARRLKRHRSAWTNTATLMAAWIRLLSSQDSFPIASIIGSVSAPTERGAVFLAMREEERLVRSDLHRPNLLNHDAFYREMRINGIDRKTSHEFIVAIADQRVELISCFMDRHPILRKYGFLH